MCSSDLTPIPFISFTPLVSPEVLSCSSTEVESFTYFLEYYLPLVSIDPPQGPTRLDGLRFEGGRYRHTFSLDEGVDASWAYRERTSWAVDGSPSDGYIEVSISLRPATTTNAGPTIDVSDAIDIGQKAAAAAAG